MTGYWIRTRILDRNISVLVPYNTVHKGNSHPLFGTQVRLTFDIVIASYTINPFLFFFSLVYYILL